LVPGGDAAALSVALAELHAQPLVRQRMARAALERVHAFTASAVLQRLEGIYGRVAA